jgi:hypothetical protein
MPRRRFIDFSQGLFLEGRRESMPEGTMRRFKGVHALTTSLLRSRPGSTEIEPFFAHSLARFDDKRFQGVTTTLKENGVSIKTGLDGTRLTFSRMPSTVGKMDSLFVAGGGDLFKVDTSSASTKWGIDVPADGTFTANVGAAGNLTGVYQYLVTFKNSVTGHRSNANPTAQSVTLAAEKGSLVNIPVSSDAQVDTREIWRTVAGGAVFFLAGSIADNVTTSFIDDTIDLDLSGTELPFDNDPPLATYEDCEGPHDGRMWWGRDTTAGSKGNIYHSPSGRAESVKASIVITNDDDPVQKIVSWKGSLYVFSEEQIFEVIGGGAEEIFTVRGIGSTVGTTQPHTIQKTSRGIIYQAHDGIRIFDGIQSTVLADNRVTRIFRGETVSGIADFNGIIATFGNEEYIVSDLNTTLAVNIITQRWREIGVAANALFFENETGKLQASFGTKTFLLEDEGTLADGSADIPFEVETPAVTSETEQGIIRRIMIDFDSNNETLSPTLILDEVETALPTVRHNGRKVQTFTLAKTGRSVALRLTASLNKEVKIWSITFEPYIPRIASQQEQS